MQPARIVEEEPVPYQLTVRWDGKELRFDDDPRTVTLADGDILILAFEGNLEGRVPGVSFTRETPAGPVGPFCDVVQTRDRVVLKGSSGAVGDFQCRAWLSPSLRRGEAPILSSNEISISNEIARKAAKEIRIDVTSGANGPRVEVDLHELTIHAPDSVVWNFVFTGFDDSAIFEPLLYVNDEPQPPGAGPFGPFESLSVARVDEPLANGGKLVYRLITSGNNGIKGVHSFDVGVLDLANGSQAYFSVVDPAIDNSGPPNELS